MRTNMRILDIAPLALLNYSVGKQYLFLPNRMGSCTIFVLLDQEFLSLDSTDLLLVKSKYLEASLLNMAIVVTIEVLNVGGSDN